MCVVNRDGDSTLAVRRRCSRRHERAHDEVRDRAREKPQRACELCRILATSAGWGRRGIRHSVVSVVGYYESKIASHASTHLALVARQGKSESRVLVRRSMPAHQAALLHGRLGGLQARLATRLCAVLTMAPHGAACLRGLPLGAAAHGKTVGISGSPSLTKYTALQRPVPCVCSRLLCSARFTLSQA
jgi:hypothetical protein